MVDYFQVDALLTEEERGFRNKVRNFVEEECMPLMADHHVTVNLCDLEAVSTLEGTESIHTLILGQDLTGFSAFH